jgi:hypothetical protein
MRYRFLAAYFALVAVLALTPILFAQNGKQTQAQKAAPANDQPFDPHDISGIWKNPGGFDVALGSDRPPMTEWGKEKWSKTRSSARNSPLSFGFYADQKDWNDPLFQCDPSGYPRNLDYSNYRIRGVLRTGPRMARPLDGRTQDPGKPQAAVVRICDCALGWRYVGG